MGAGYRITLMAQCRICRQMGHGEATTIGFDDGKYPEIDMVIMLDHNNPEGQMCTGAGTIASFQGDWMYEKDGRTHKTFATVCPGCSRHIQCVGQPFIIPTHWKNDGGFCEGSLYFPDNVNLIELREQDIAS